MIEEEASKILIQFAVDELRRVGLDFLGFTLDQFDETEEEDFTLDDVFESRITQKINSLYLGDIAFVDRKYMNQVSLNKETEILKIDNNFNCLSNNQELSKFFREIFPG